MCFNVITIGILVQTQLVYLFSTLIYYHYFHQSTLKECYIWLNKFLNTFLLIPPSGTTIYSVLYIVYIEYWLWGKCCVSKGEVDHCVGWSIIFFGWLVLDEVGILGRNGSISHRGWPSFILEQYISPWENAQFYYFFFLLLFIIFKRLEVLLNIVYCRIQYFTCVTHS